MKRVAFIAVVVFLASCSPKVLYNWKGYDNAVYSYTKVPDETNTAKLIETYKKLIAKPEGMRNVPPPGVCADYGYLLIKAGMIDEGRALLLRETELYPESKPFIALILKRFQQ